MPLKALALDPSMTATGWASGITTQRGIDFQTIKTGTIRADGVNDYAGQLNDLIKQECPDVLAYETARRDIAMYGKKGLLPGKPGFITPNASQLVLLEIQGVIVGVASFHRLALIPVAVKTWRAQILGNGNMEREAAKKAARAYCQQLGIKARSEDANEAACILCYVASQPEIRFHDR